MSHMKKNSDKFNFFLTIVTWKTEILDLFLDVKFVNSGQRTGYKKTRRVAVGAVSAQECKINTVLHVKVAQ